MYIVRTGISPSSWWERGTLWINPTYTSARGIANGDAARAIMASFVCLQDGAWPTFDGDGVEMSGSPNILVPTEQTIPRRVTRTHMIFVEVEKS